MRLAPATFQRLRELAHRACGLALTDDKSYLVEHRLGPIVVERGLKSFEELCDSLVNCRDASWHDTIVEALTTRETSFFRDTHPFDALRTRVWPSWTIDPGRSHRRIWSAGSSTGQEPYSLAMVAWDYATANPVASSRLDVSILATDVCASALASAREGIFELRELQRGLTPQQTHRYCEPVGKSWRMREPLRRLIDFRRLNLVDPLGALGPFDLILCRNVLIYFDEPTRRRLIQEFHARLVPNGLLLLGAAENLFGLSNDFESERMGETLIYRKRSG